MTSPRADRVGPGSSTSLRTANEHRILATLRSDAAVFTQAELARATGLAPATVSNIVKGLAARGVVDAEPGSGRRGAAVRLSPRAGAVAGVDFGHSHGDLDHRAGLRLARSMLDHLRPPEAPLRAVGLGLPAPLAREVVQSSEIFPGWRGVNARAVAEEIFGVPVHVENDANLGALAEHRAGAAKGHESSVYVKASSGVGAGIVVGNELFHGAHGTAGELGHITLDEQGPPCRCGKRGCLEAYTSTPFVARELAGAVPGAHDVEAVVEAARQGNVAARRTLDEVGHHLGRGLASVVNLINPAIVVIGGDLATAEDLLLEPVRISLRRYALDPVAATPVLVGALRTRASMMGAVLLAAERTKLVG